MKKHNGIFFMKDKICQECGKNMVYDFERDEYYCPICGCMESINENVYTGLNWQYYNY